MTRNAAMTKESWSLWQEKFSPSNESAPILWAAPSNTVRKLSSSLLSSVLFCILEYSINCRRRGMTRSLSQLITLLFDPVLLGFVYRKEFSTLKAVYSISSHSPIPTFGILSTHTACSWGSLLCFLGGVNWHPHWLWSHQEFFSIALFCPKPEAQFFTSTLQTMPDILCLFTRSALRHLQKWAQPCPAGAKWRLGKSRWVESMPGPYTFLYILSCLLMWTHRYHSLSLWAIPLKHPLSSFSPWLWAPSVPAALQGSSAGVWCWAVAW